MGGDLAVNRLPPHVSVSDMCEVVEKVTARDFPEATFINGFLMLFKRSAFDSVRGFDEDSFPVGYGEENDFAVRLQDHGYTLAFADNSYAYHFKTTGFSLDEETTL